MAAEDPRDTSRAMSQENRARGKESGVDTTSPLAFRFRVRDGRIVRGESYLDVNEAFEAVGLSE
jgi:ketosteroid isomerase-like protein